MGSEDVSRDMVEAQQKAIEAEEVLSQPLIGDGLPIEVLLVEFEASPHHLQKLQILSRDFGTFRKIRGDGNCFFRALAFCLFEMLAGVPDRSDKIVVLAQTWRSLLDAANFDRIAYEDFFDESFYLIKDFCERAPRMRALGLSPSDWLAEDWRSNEINSNSIVLTLRMVLSAYLQLNYEEYLPFLYDFEAAGLEGKQMMESYARRHVESFGVESDQIHIMAMTKVMGCQIEIAYLDASEHAENLLMAFGEPAGFWAAAQAATLLYRPGHYDIIYRSIPSASSE